VPRTDTLRAERDTNPQAVATYPKSFRNMVALPTWSVTTLEQLNHREAGAGTTRWICSLQTLGLNLSRRMSVFRDFPQVFPDKRPHSTFRYTISESYKILRNRPQLITYPIHSQKTHAVPAATTLNN
jgi:hypothetical protein